MPGINCRNIFADNYGGFHVRAEWYETGFKSELIFTATDERCEEQEILIKTNVLMFKRLHSLRFG